MRVWPSILLANYRPVFRRPVDFRRHLHEEVNGTTPPEQQSTSQEKKSPDPVSSSTGSPVQSLVLDNNVQEALAPVSSPSAEPITQTTSEQSPTDAPIRITTGDRAPFRILTEDRAPNRITTKDGARALTSDNVAEFLSRLKKASAAGSSSKSKKPRVERVSMGRTVSSPYYRTRLGRDTGIRPKKAAVPSQTSPGPSTRRLEDVVSRLSSRRPSDSAPSSVPSLNDTCTALIQRVPQLVANGSSVGSAQSKGSKSLTLLQPISVLLVGASGVVGQAIAKAFASHLTYPFHLTLVGRDANKLQSLRSEIPRLNYGGWSHSVLVGDVTKSEFWGDTRRKWTDHPNLEGGIMIPSILINCAGSVERSLLSVMSPVTVQEQVDVNLMATMWACKLFAHRKLVAERRNMLERGEATSHGFTPSIVNVGSLLSSRAGQGCVPYATSKAAISGLTRALASEYGRMGMRVNAVHPGFIDSTMAQQGKLHTSCRLFAFASC